MDRPRSTLRMPGDAKISKRYRFSGWDLKGDPIGELAFGLVDKDGGRFGFCIAGTNNQRKSVVFDDPAVLDELIEALTKFRDSHDMDACRFQAAVKT